MTHACCAHCTVCYHVLLAKQTCLMEILCRACGVAVPHPLSMREALDSIPSMSSKVRMQIKEKRNYTTASGGAADHVQKQVSTETDTPSVNPEDTPNRQLERRASHACKGNTASTRAHHMVGGDFDSRMLRHCTVCYHVLLANETCLMDLVCRACGVVVSHPRCMREALGSIPSMSSKVRMQIKEKRNHTPARG